jgi:hypothetical protein
MKARDSPDVVPPGPTKIDAVFVEYNPLSGSIKSPHPSTELNCGGALIQAERVKSLSNCGIVLDKVDPIREITPLLARSIAPKSLPKTSVEYETVVEVENAFTLSL